MGLIERDVIPDLELGYNAILGFPSKNGAMTIMEACRLEKISEQDAVRMLHVQVCSVPVYFINFRRYLSCFRFCCSYFRSTSGNFWYEIANGSFQGCNWWYLQSNQAPSIAIENCYRTMSLES